jgi:hypothetical protein
VTGVQTCALPIYKANIEDHRVFGKTNKSCQLPVL